MGEIKGFLCIQSLFQFVKFNSKHVGRHLNNPIEYKILHHIGRHDTEPWGGKKNHILLYLLALNASMKYTILPNFGRHVEIFDTTLKRAVKISTEISYPTLYDCV